MRIRINASNTEAMQIKILIHQSTKELCVKQINTHIIAKINKTSTITNYHHITSKGVRRKTNTKYSLHQIPSMPLRSKK